MSDNGLDSVEPTQIPEPLIKKSNSISLIWLVPLIAALIGGVLAIKAVLSKGPTITIEFASAEGLVAEKTRIKYKEVEVGRVVAIQLDEQLAHVKVTAEMIPEIGPYLTDATRFWVVRARVGPGEVSGLGTLFSGVYLAMDPGRSGARNNQFKGLESPPVVTMDTPGRYFTLNAAELGSLNVGAPVYYRRIKVGQVVHYEMQPEGRAVEIRIFVRSPHDKRVTTNTRFWNAGGIDMTVDATGVRINTESLLTLIEGGIAFGTPENLEPGDPVVQDYAFTLYPDFKKINEPTYARKFHFLALFDGTVRGLTKGAPVEFRGIKIGEVVDLKLEFNADESTFRIPVLCVIEPERIAFRDNLGEPQSAGTDPTEMISTMVRKGLRAQLRTGVMLTGQLFVSLDIHPGKSPATLTYVGKYPVLPTVPEPVQEITASLTHLLERLEKLPIEQIGADLGSTVHSAKMLVGSSELREAVVNLNQSLGQLERFTLGLNADLSPRLTAVLEQSRQAASSGHKALSAAEKIFGADAPLNYELSQTLKELSRAAQAVSALADLLERNPQVLIYGKGTPQ